MHQKHTHMWRTVFTEDWDVFCAVEHEQHDMAGKVYVYKDFIVGFSFPHLVLCLLLNPSEVPLFMGDFNACIFDKQATSHSSIMDDREKLDIGMYLKH